MNVTGRAYTAEEKRVIIERLYEAWLKAPEQRLGQLLVNAVTMAPQTLKPLLFQVEDEQLVVLAELIVITERLVKGIT